MLVKMKMAMRFMIRLSLYLYLNLLAALSFTVLMPPFANRRVSVGFNQGSKSLPMAIMDLLIGPRKIQNYLIRRLLPLFPTQKPLAYMANGADRASKKALAYRHFVRCSLFL